MSTISSRGHIPHPLTNWEYPTASSAKYGFLLSKFDCEIDPRLGKRFQTLIEGLHDVFRKMLVQAALADDEPPPIHHDKIYHVMLYHVRDAIDDLNRETQDGVTALCELSHEEEGNLDIPEGSK